MSNTKKVKKIVVVALLAGVVSVAGAGVAYAASHVAGCVATDTNIRCTGPIYSHEAGGHQVKVTESNITVLCVVTETYGRHDTYCANKECNVNLGTDTRVCNRYHDCYLCTPETGICQQ
ncbi:MAG: hypothetical protein ACI4QX_05465 [Lachnospiraceae bacterium]